VSPSSPCESGKIVIFYALKGPSELAIRLLLRPRGGPAGALDPAEVDRVYSREAAGYDAKHHRTTRGQDLQWRRTAGWLVAAAGEKRPAVLDLCTGTGLTALEIAPVLRAHWREADITALNYNEAMLAEARKRSAQVSELGSTIRFVRGDATALTGSAPAGFQTLPGSSFDIAARVFGIDGIGDPVAVANSVLSVLREGGRFLLIDMHRPMLDLPGEWALPGYWVRFPRWKYFNYAKTTLPLVAGAAVGLARPNSRLLSGTPGLPRGRGRALRLSPGLAGHRVGALVVRPALHADLLAAAGESPARARRI
jgi:ubiquinone/menaquinone biosynthesis C-methylase UbiE